MSEIVLLTQPVSQAIAKKILSSVEERGFGVVTSEGEPHAFRVVCDRPPEFPEVNMTSVVDVGAICRDIEGAESIVENVGRYSRSHRTKCEWVNREIGTLLLGAARTPGGVPNVGITFWTKRELPDFGQTYSKLANGTLEAAGLKALGKLTVHGDQFLSGGDSVRPRSEMGSDDRGRLGKDPALTSYALNFDPRSKYASLMLLGSPLADAVDHGRWWSELPGEGFKLNSIRVNLTMEEDRYRDWTGGLEADGAKFEIAFSGALEDPAHTWHSIIERVEAWEGTILQLQNQHVTDGDVGLVWSGGELRVRARILEAQGDLDSAIVQVAQAIEGGALPDRIAWERD